MKCFERRWKTLRPIQPAEPLVEMGRGDKTKCSMKAINAVEQEEVGSIAAELIMKVKTSKWSFRGTRRFSN